jgi:2-dehydro-3-deoxygluconokinase
MIVFGECMGELSGSGRDRRLGVGGDTFNTAVYLARLGVPLAYATVLGVRDPISDLIMSSLEEEGIDTALVQRVPGRLPGLYLIETACDGERRFHYWRDRSPVRDFTQGDVAALLEAVAGNRGFYFSGITLAVIADEARHALLRGLVAVRERGTLVAFDANFRPMLWPDRAVARRAVDAAAASSTLVSVSAEDMESLFGSDARQAVARWAAGGREVVVRKRDLVSEVCSGGQHLSLRACPSGTVVDTTGAGDGYNAGYLAARLRGVGVARAVAVAQALSARVVQHPGAIIPASEVHPIRQMLEAS